MKTFTINSEGSLIVHEVHLAQPRLDANGVQLTDGQGTKLYAETGCTIQPAQIAAHRRDPLFEAALDAAAGTAGNLTLVQLAALPAPS